MARLADNRLFSSQFQGASKPQGCGDSADQEAPCRDTRTLELQTPFFEVPQDRVMTPLRLLLFRIFSFTLGRSYAVNNWVKTHLIIGVVIHRRRRGALNLRRRVIYLKEGVF